MRRLKRLHLILGTQHLLIIGIVFTLASRETFGFTVDTPTPTSRPSSEASTPIPAPLLPVSPPRPALQPNGCPTPTDFGTLYDAASLSQPQATRSGGVFYLFHQGENSQIHFTAKPSAPPEAITNSLENVQFFQVSPNQESLLFVAANSETGSSVLRTYNVKTKITEEIVKNAEAQIRSVMWDGASRWFVYTVYDASRFHSELRRHDLVTKEDQRILDMDGELIATDVGPKHDLIALTQALAPSQSRIYLWSISKKQLTPISPDAGAREYGAKIASNSTSIFFISNRPLNQKPEQHFQLANPELHWLSLLKGAERFILTAPAGRTEEFEIDETRTKIVTTHYKDGVSTFQGFSVDNSGKQIKALALPKNKAGVVFNPRFTANFGSGGIFYAKTNSTSPAQIYLWMPYREMLWTKAERAPLPTKCFAEAKMVRYPSFDGVSIEAILYAPPKPNPPFLVYVHDGPWQHFKPSFSRTIQHWVNNGFGVLIPNYRGSNQGDAAFADLDNQGKRLDSARDLIEGAKWLVKNKTVASNRVGIFGSQLGGMLALHTLHLEPMVFSALAESLGILSMASFLKQWKGIQAEAKEAEFGKIGDSNLMRDLSPSSYLESYPRTKMLLIHGTNDPRIPIRETEHFYNTLKLREVEVELKIIPENVKKEQLRKDAIEEITTLVSFFKTNLEAVKPIDQSKTPTAVPTPTVSPTTTATPTTTSAATQTPSPSSSSSPSPSSSPTTPPKESPLKTQN